LEKYIYSNLLAAVIFNDNYLNYTIRVHGELIVDPEENPITNYFESRIKNITKADTYTNIFSPLQLVIDQAIIQTKTNKGIKLEYEVGKMSKVSLSLFKDQNISKDLKITRQLLYSAVSLISMIFFVQLINIMKHILIEKEHKQE